ncbi:MAG: hypothetical protein CM15mP127_14610 [Gammaproteobacteria bacterium]|nr:MAG: hypothetical protein CM15mP127_14610 [Gammaproteobacteria bacterium]
MVNSFSSMVAFITSVFEAKLDELRRGCTSIVLEKDHTLFWFGDRILEVIRELIEANDSEPDAAIVILQMMIKSIWTITLEIIY